MTCARRLAGARKPASPSESPRRPDPRPGRRRARLSLLLPCFALLLCGLHLLAAAPAAAQTQGAPQNVVATPGNAKLTLTWQAPSSWAGTINRFFLVQWKLSASGSTAWAPVKTPDGGADETFAEADTSYEFTGYQEDSGGTGHTVSNGTAYDLRVRARSRIGGTHYHSAWVTLSNLVPGVPLAISTVTVTPGAGKLDLSWTAPTSSVSAITGYDVHYTSSSTVGDDADASGNDASAAWVAVSRSGTTASQTIPSLTGGTAYRVRVRAKNTHGNAAWVFGTGTPVKTPELTGLSLSVGGNAVALTPAFAAATTSYTATVPHDATSVSVTPTWATPVSFAAVTSWTPNLGTELTSTVTLTSSGTSATMSLASSGDTWVYVTISGTGNVLTNYRIDITRAPPPIAVTLSASPNPVPEGSIVEVTATLSAPAPAAVTLRGTVTNDTAESGDHSAPASFDLGFSSGSTSLLISLPTNHDADADDETFTVALGALPSGYVAGSPSSVQIRIADDEGLPEVSLSVSPNPVREGLPVTVEARLTKGGVAWVPPGTVRIPVSVVRSAVVGSEAERGDLCRVYEKTFSVDVHIQGGGHRRSVGVARLPTCHDADSDDEAFGVAVDAGRLPAGYVRGSPADHIIVIDDDEDDGGPPGGRTVTLSVTPNPVREGGTVTVTATLEFNGEPLLSPGYERIPLRVYGMTSEAGDHGTLSQIAIPGEGTSGTATIATRRDGDRDDERFVVELGRLPGHIGPGRCPAVLVTISEGGAVRLDPCTGRSVDAGLVRLGVRR